MKNYGWVLFVVVLVILGGLYGYMTKNERSTLKLGFIAELTGDIPAVGESSKKGAELAVAEINEAGGLTVGGQRYEVELVTVDNQGNADKTKEAVNKLVDENKVVAVIGPNASRYAIPAGEAAEAKETLLISPWSTNPKTTLNADNKPKHYVFRAAYTDPFQGQVLAKFATGTVKAKNAAILYDSSADVLVGQAEYFKNTFEKDGGKVVAYESFKAGDKSVADQLNKIKAARADIIFLPGYYNDTAAIIKQAHAMGITTQFLGSDAWASADLFGLCGSDCNNYYLTAHYAADSTHETTKKFVDAFKAKYDATPDDVAALTYDSFGLVFDSLTRAGKVDRASVRDAMAETSDYDGVTGTIRYQNDSGDPVKSAVIMQIKDGKFVWSANAQP